MYVYCVYMFVSMNVLCIIISIYVCMNVYCMNECMYACMYDKQIERQTYL